MYVDYIKNGEAFGPVGEQLQGCRFDAGLLRPYLDERGRKCVTVNTGRSRYDREKHKFVPVYEKALVSEMIGNGIPIPVANATTLRKDEWIELDRVVLAEARARLRAWTDLAAANTFSVSGMSREVLEHETMSDPGEAQVDMDGLSEGRGDTPVFQLEGLPLPITHSDFHYSARKLATSRNIGQPLDTTMAGIAGRRVAETIEKMVIGTVSAFAYGASTAYSQTAGVYGYITYPDTNSKTDLSTPDGTNPEAVVQDVLEMRDLLYADNFFGPYVLYTSTAYDQWLDNDYFRSGGTSVTRTLRERLEAIEGITAVRRLDYLTAAATSKNYAMILVQMTPDVARAVNGMDITTVQWESKGGMQLNFKVMAIQVPQFRSDYSGRCGIVYATTAA